MNLKKILFISLALFILSLSAVSAADINDIDVNDDSELILDS